MECLKVICLSRCALSPIISFSWCDGPTFDSATSERLKNHRHGFRSLFNRFNHIIVIAGQSGVSPPCLQTRGKRNTAQAIGLGCSFAAIQWTTRPNHEHLEASLDFRYTIARSNTSSNYNAKSSNHILCPTIHSLRTTSCGRSPRHTNPNHHHRAIQKLHHLHSPRKWHLHDHLQPDGLDCLRNCPDRSGEQVHGLQLQPGHHLLKQLRLRASNRNTHPHQHLSKRHS